MRHIIGLSIAILLLGYGLIRIGVGGALLAQSLAMVDFAELADAVSEVKLFIDARANEQLFPFSVPAYFAYIMAMGTALSAGATGAIARRRWGHALLGIYLAMHAALFVNFQEINPKLVGLVATAAMLFALVYLRPPKPLD
jgi:hypothetical protein